MNNITIKPRKPEVIKEELRELELAGSSSREWLQNHPEDDVVSFLIEQDKSRKDELIQELKESYSYYYRHFFSYSIKTDSNVDINNLSKLLGIFDKVINATLGHVSKTVKSIPLYFDTVFQSSFGIALSTDWDSELIDTSYEKTFNKFFDIISNLPKMESESNDNILELFSNDKGLMHTYRSFYRSISYYDKPIDLKWGGFLERYKRNYLVDSKEAMAVFKQLVNIDHPEPEDVKVTGSIQGVSLIDHSLQFVPHQKEGTRIRLTFDDTFKDKLKQLLGEVATIVYRVKVEYDEVKDKNITMKSLLKIEE